MSIVATLRQRFASILLGTHQYRGQETVLVKREGLLEVARFLKSEPSIACDILMDLTAADYLKFGKSLASAPLLRTPSPLPYYMTSKPVAETWERGVSNDEHRFEVVYHFYSTRYNRRIRVKVPLTAADPVVDSLTPLWEGANWFEREVWDMFGIRFTGHPDLRRLLMYGEFEGHPLRKNYPFNKRQPLIGPNI